MIRDELVTFLRRELVGPDPVEGSTQANGEEILFSEPPRLRYGAGVLFPQAVITETAGDVTAGEESAPPVEVEDGQLGVGDEEEEVTGNELYDEEGVDAPLQKDLLTATDDPVSLANAYLPSAIGLSCLVAVPKGGFCIAVEAAIYLAKPFKYRTRKGEERDGKKYERQPLRVKLEIPAHSLLADGVNIEKRAILKPDGEDAGLEVRIVSRPHRTEEGGNDQRLLTVVLVNTFSSGGRAENEKCFFQAGLELRCADGTPCFLEYPEHVGESLDEDDESMSLLYRDEKTYAIGHGCAAEWDEEEGVVFAVRTEVLPVHEVKPVVPARLSGLELRMLTLSDKGEIDKAFGLLTSLADRYEEWISQRQAQVDASEFPAAHRSAACRHVDGCRKCLRRLRAGIDLLSEDSQVLLAFQLANRTMLLQQLHYLLASEHRRDWRDSSSGLEIDEPEWPDLDAPPAGRGSWYPFQLAFILMNLPAMADPTGADRRLADLIWFPTGGGKTEAYLGLTAFAIFLRRLREPSTAGTAVLMRYTLRLLTTQQFQRASSLICACETIRREMPDRIGGERISIGLWVGNTVTPGSRADARKSLNQLADGNTNQNPFIVLACPWCGAQMGPVEVGDRFRGIKGYDETPHPRTVIFRCPDPHCEFADAAGLPLCVIDEDIYASPPTLVIGTVDKFALLPWKPETYTLFGDRREACRVKPPELIIQDELHLISGPLGSMVGHYETVIQQLCAVEHNGQSVGPKVVASTATISRAKEQCHALYNCGSENVFLFPPQGLKAGESFFSQVDRGQPGRQYVGVHASALPSHVTAQVRVLSALLQAPASVTLDALERDPYWTLVVYFNSLRELSHAATLIRADIREYLNGMWLRKGIKRQEERQKDIRRFINRTLELTSREPNTEIPLALQRLSRRFPEAVDVCIATNMIQVGIDVPRLGLMAVVGQPKTTSEYIQATSRVGRSAQGPGLVVTVYNPARPRDRSHYEHFRSYHAAIYRWVEPTSVTPFAAPVRERALHALLVTLVRSWGSPDNRARPQPYPAERLLGKIREVIMNRVGRVDKDEREKTREWLDYLLERWNLVLPPRYGDFGPARPETPLIYPAGSKPHREWEGLAWPTPSSMRNVDATCEAFVCRQYPQLGLEGDAPP